MKLTQFTDYALRLLIRLAAAGPGYRTTIPDAAALLQIPVNHLTKIAHRLAKADLIKASRGRAGGLSLARPASAITLGDVIRITEPDFALVGCMAGRSCALEPNCVLVAFLNDALGAFLRTTDRTTLSDLVVTEASAASCTPASSRNAGS